MNEELPTQLLDVGAICDQRDMYRQLAQIADILLQHAPLHHYGKEYDAWRKDVAAWRVKLTTGNPCEHPTEWRTGDVCGCCLETLTQADGDCDAKR